MAVDDEGAAASDTAHATVTYNNATPTITIEKTGPATIAEGGANVVYDFVITNKSCQTDPVTITALADNTFNPADNTAMFTAALAAYQAIPGNETAKEIVLQPNGTLSFSFDPSGVLVLDAGQTHINTVTVDGKDDEETPVSDTDDHTITGTDPLPLS